MTYLALDYGTKHTGLALSPDGVVVWPLEVCPTKDLKAKLETVIAEKQITTVIAGIPTVTGQSNDEWAMKLQKEVQKLSKKFLRQEWVTVNERFSTRLAQAQSLDHGRVDDLAAVEILERYLQGIKH